MNKKKVLISQPMRGLSTEQIKANREQAVETVITNGCEVLDSILTLMILKMSKINHCTIWQKVLN